MQLPLKPERCAESCSGLSVHIGGCLRGKPGKPEVSGKHLATLFFKVDKQMSLRDHISVILPYWNGLLGRRRKQQRSAYGKHKWMLTAGLEGAQEEKTGKDGEHEVGKLSAGVWQEAGHEWSCGCEIRFPTSFPRKKWNEYNRHYRHKEITNHATTFSITLL